MGWERSQLKIHLFFFFNSTPQGGIRSWCNRLGGSCQREPLRKCWGLRGWRKTPVLEEKYSDSCMKSGIDEASVHMFKSWLLWFHQSLPFPPVLVGIQRALITIYQQGRGNTPREGCCSTFTPCSGAGLGMLNRTQEPRSHFLISTAVWVRKREVEPC